MGHQHLLKLPKTRAWKAVVALLIGGADVAALASATAAAANHSMIKAADDSTVRHSFYLLTQIPLAARSDDFAAGLRRLGMSVTDEPSLVEVGTAMMEAIDNYTEARGLRTDYGEIAQLAAVESLQAVAGKELFDLFGAEGIRVRSALFALADSHRFAGLARDFFSRLTRRHLAFYLSREMASHVGNGRRFPSLVDHERFEAALDLHCREASLIIKDFASGWFYNHCQLGSYDHNAAGNFVHVATKKIREELKQRHVTHA
jgi:hypothetical protein